MNLSVKWQNLQKIQGIPFCFVKREIFISLKAGLYYIVCAENEHSLLLNTANLCPVDLIPDFISKPVWEKYLALFVDLWKDSGPKMWFLESLSLYFGLSPYV